MIKIAGIQMEIFLMDKERNITRCLDFLSMASKEGARLVIFPEATLTGYVFNNLNEALPFAEPVPGPSVERIIACCRESHVYTVFGLLEQGGQSRCYNTAVLVGPDGFIGKYRKLHLPYIGVDRFLNHGDLPLRVYDTDIGRIGLGICYDLDFPEHARALTLLGAEVIVTITNWPQGIEFVPEHMVPVRARENYVYQIAVNRVGNERGISFFGNSKVVDYKGVLVVEGKHFEEDILYAEIDPTLAKRKHQVMISGKLEIDTIRDRRPDFYGPLVQPLIDSSRIR
jgi:predicted amidohydrolase